LSQYHQKLADLPEDGGMMVLAGFNKGYLPLRNANPKVRGPNKPEMLFSTESFKNGFPDFEVIKLKEDEVELNERNYHNGICKVMGFIGRRSDSN